VAFSISTRTSPRLRRHIEAIPDAAWTPIPYPLEDGADVAETVYVPFAEQPQARPVRLIVRRVRPLPGSQLALLTLYAYHAFITDREGDTLELEADHRRHAEVEAAIRDLKYGVGLNHLPSGRFAANGTGWPSRSWPTTSPAGRPGSASLRSARSRRRRSGGGSSDSSAG
jgi:hypothetical protein